MKPFTFAIASIVDANTGNGLVHRAGAPDYRAYEQRAGRIRSASIIGLVDALGGRLGAAINGYRLRAKQRRALRDLLRLNDRLLEDIGLSRRDLLSVELGVTTLEELDAGRRTARGPVAVDLGQSAETGQVDRQPEAANARFYHESKCA